MDCQERDIPSVKTLVEGAVAGDGAAWRMLVERYHNRVFGLIFRQCGDRDLADEITQQTFVKLVVQFGRQGKKTDKSGEKSGGKAGASAGETGESVAGYREEGKFESWLFRIAMNKLRDEMRRRKRQARPMDMTPGGGADGGDGGGGGQWAMVQDKVLHLTAVSEEDPLANLERAEQVEHLRSAVAALPEADREILHLRHTAGLSFPQIAESLDQPLGTVLARAHRAVAKLRKALGPLELEDDELDGRRRSAAV